MIGKITIPSHIWPGMHPAVSTARCSLESGLASCNSNPNNDMKAKSILRSAGVFAGLGLMTFNPIVSAQTDAQAARDSVVHGAQGKEFNKLIALIRPVGDSKVKGTVLFEKTAEGIKITAKVGGLTPDSSHGFHIHEFGDLGSEDATSAGGHFNPDSHPHGKPDTEPRHAGDLGELKADGDGNANQVITVRNIVLGHGSNGILGRAVIVHAKPDDGSQPSGNAGERIGAGVIGISKDAMSADHTGAPSPAPETDKPSRPVTGVDTSGVPSPPRKATQPEGDSTSPAPGTTPPNASDPK